MNKNRKLVLILLIFTVLFCSLTAVSAADVTNNDTDDVNTLGNTNTINNFTQLQGEIDNSDVVNLTNDVVRENGENPILINKSVVINGYGYTIDACNLGSIFNVTNGSLILNNVSLTNANNRVIYVNNSTAVISNCIFNHNTASKGSDIYAVSGNIMVEDCVFINSVTNWSSIYVEKSYLNVTNSSFSNLVSNYATAIGASSSNVTVSNSKFKNLTSKITAGAIGVKDTNLNVDNCEFINTSSVKDAGAIYVDICELGSIRFTISNSNFTNCSSGFGGAVVLLNNREGINSFDNCSFIDDVASFNGGAIFTSITIFNITNSNFINNKAVMVDNSSSIVKYGNGGAIYLDGSIVIINETNFESNEVSSQGGAIFAYDGNLTLINVNSSFNSQLGKYGVYGTFLESYVSLNSSITDTVSVNNTFYVNVVTGTGTSIELVNDTIVIKNLTKFDLRDYHWVTPVRNQGKMGACWTFGTCAAIESALLRKTNVTYDLSENNMQNTELIYSIFGGNQYIESGNNHMGAAYALSWLGVFSEDYDSYDQLGKLSPVICLNDTVHIQDVLFIKPSINGSNVDAIKNALINYGAVAIAYNHNWDFYNATTKSFYDTNNESINHAVTIVGWDDTFSRTNFINMPAGDGAFIVKNSWGTDWGDNGYFYLSYYNFLKQGVAYILNNTVNYNKNYQLDYNEVHFSSEVGWDYNYGCNVYTSSGNDLIAAVGTYFNESSVDYEVSIYVNGVLKHSQKGVSAYYGYSTIPLTKYIPVFENDTIKVQMKSNTVPVSVNSRVYLKDNVSFVSNDGVSWEDLSDVDVAVVGICLKVYTIDISYYAPDLAVENCTMYYHNGSGVEARLTYNNQSITGENVTISVNSVSYTLTTDDNGDVVLPIGLASGNYLITTVYNGTYGYACTNSTLTVLPTIKGENVTVYCRNGSGYYVHVTNGQGNPLIGVNVSMNINGVFYDRVTDSNGYAYLPIGLNAGKYIITSENPINGELTSNIVTVLATLVDGQDVSVYHRNGSGYSIKALDGQGNPVKGVTVRMNINGVFYDRVTDSNGYAFLPIGLNPGDYIITTEYNGFMTSNKITVLPVLLGDDVTLYYRDGTSYKVKLLNDQGKPLTYTNVTMNINGVFYYRTTNTDGVADLPIGLLPGKYIITTTYQDHATSNVVTVLARD